MTTTELIDFLKKHERGGATGRPREITLTVNGTFMPHPHFYVDSTDDGLYTGICIGVSGDVEQEDTEGGCAVARLIDAEATKLAICRDECGADAEECSRMCCRFADVIDEMPTAFDVKLLMKKIATLDRIAKSDKQKALLGRVFFIIENMIEENEKEQNDALD